MEGLGEERRDRRRIGEGEKQNRKVGGVKEGEREREWRWKRKGKRW